MYRNFNGRISNRYKFDPNCSGIKPFILEINVYLQITIFLVFDNGNHINIINYNYISTVYDYSRKCINV